MKSAGWRLAAATVIGTSHIKSGDVCQDSHQLQLVGADEDILVAVVSDGAGSASHSHIGSRLACSKIIEAVVKHFESGQSIQDITQPLVEEWLENLASELEMAAENEGVEVRQLACTLVAAIVSPEFALFFQVGDGAIVIRPEGDTWMYVFWPQHGEYINATYFITDPISRSRFEFGTDSARIEDVALFTDGIEALVLQYATREVQAPFFDRMIAPVQALTESGLNDKLSAALEGYLGSEIICDRTDDDKTLILASMKADMALEPESENQVDSKSDDTKG